MKCPYCNVLKLTNPYYHSFANPHGDPDHLNSDVNLKMIHHSSHLIGAAAAFRAPQKESNRFLEENANDTWRRVRIKILTIMRFGGTIRSKKRDGAHGSLKGGKQPRMKKSTLAKMHEVSVRLRKDFKTTALQAKDDLQTKANRWVTKMHGGNAGETISCRFMHHVLSIMLTLLFYLAQRYSSFFHLDTNSMELCWCLRHSRHPFAIELFHHDGDR